MTNETIAQAQQIPAHEAILHAILPHPDENRILALVHDSGWTLPQLQPTEDSHDTFDFFEFGMNTQNVLGCAVTALYCPSMEYANDTHGDRFVFVLENRNPAFQPPEGSRWITSDELGSV